MKCFILSIVLIFCICFSCRTPFDNKNKLIQQTDSLLAAWNELAISVELQNDSLLFIQNFNRKNQMLQIMTALKNDTLVPDDIQIIENFFAAFECYENNYFNLKKIKYFSKLKRQNLQFLRSDIANEIIFSEAGMKFIQNEKDQLNQTKLKQSQLYSEYEKCKGLVTEFFRDALKMYAQHHHGIYPSFFNDSLPYVP